MGLLARFLAAWFGKATWLPSTTAWRVPAWLLSVLLVLNCCVAAPFRLSAPTTQLARVKRFYFEDPLVTLAAEGASRGKTLFFVNPPSAVMMTLIPYVSTELADSLPERSHVLSSGLHGHIDVARIDARTLDIEPQDGFASADVDRLWRSPRYPMVTGQRIELGDMTVEVQSVMPDGRPRRARFRFARPVDDPSYLFIRHTLEGIAPFDLPDVGRSVRLPWSIRLAW
jgi:hypothetical protein